MILRPIITATASVLALGAVLGLATPARAAGGVPASWLPPELGLVGVWNVTVTITNCVSGLPVTLPPPAVNPFPAMNQFGIDGSEFEVGAATPSSQRYPSFGTWSYSGLRKFESSFVFYRYDASGQYLGTQKVQRTITLSPDADSFTSTSKFWRFDPSQALTMQGCATEAAVRQ